MTTRQAILIAEDSSEDVFLLKRAFLKAGIDAPLAFAQDGEEAISYLAGTDKFADRNTYPFPGLILLDLKMPKLNGFEVLEWLQGQPGLKRLVVAVFTSSAAAIDVNRAYNLGANSYLIKPASANDYVVMAEKVRSYWLEFNQPPDCVAEPL
jgi:CheY-like chemotaxis protein